MIHEHGIHLYNNVQTKFENFWNSKLAGVDMVLYLHSRMIIPMLNLDELGYYRISDFICTKMKFKWLQWHR